MLRNIHTHNCAQYAICNAQYLTALYIFGYCFCLTNYKSACLLLPAQSAINPFFFDSVPVPPLSCADHASDESPPMQEHKLGHVNRGCPELFLFIINPPIAAAPMSTNTTMAIVEADTPAELPFLPSPPQLRGTLMWETLFCAS